MSDNRIEREFMAFDEALKRPIEERAAFLRERYAEDPEFVARVLRLLAAEEEEASRGSESILRETLSSSLEEPLPEAVGPYRVLARLGEGGMGIVYAAEQRAPLQRRVALKVIKPGMDSREVLARFEVERQAMAMLDHAGIAKALDAGVTEEGRPYFVMELVQGVPLDDFCRRHALTLRQRLELFVMVCAAVQHAHHRGVIHRDLKPSNILVAEHGGEPTPKVIDFGIAKAMTGRLTAATLFTSQGQVMGTPEYMSPEQAELTGGDVDTRSDIYSLGAVLYELLTGTPPFSSRSLRSQGYLQILQHIREVEPPRPSTRIREHASDEPPGFIDPSVSYRTLRGDLDWIVMRALEKDPRRRYGTVNALLEDVQRYLDVRPVLAGPPTAAYAFLKFIRRHRLATALVLLLSVSLLIGIVGLSIGLHQAREAEALARSRAEQSQAGATFLERILFQSDPEQGGGSPTLLQVMKRAGALIDDELGAFPEVEARVRESLGVALRRRSLYARAAPHLKRSLELRRELFGAHALETARSQVSVANLQFEYEGLIAKPLDHLRAALSAQAEHDRLGTAAEGWIQLDLGLVLLAGDALHEADVAFVRCQELLQRALGPRHPDCSRPVRGMALVALARGETETAEQLARRAVGLCIGPKASYIRARAQSALASILIAADRLDDASELFDQIAQVFSARVPGRHIRHAEREALIARLHLREREVLAARDAASRGLRLCRDLLHEDHPAILEGRLLVQRALLGLGDLDAARGELPAIERSLALLLGSDHPLTIEAVTARLKLATLLKDGRGKRALKQRLAQLIARRAERLRKD